MFFLRFVSLAEKRVWFGWHRLLSHSVYLYVFYMASYSVDTSKVNNATQYSNSMALKLKTIFHAENPILIDWPDWGKVSPADIAEREVNDTRHCF